MDNISALKKIFKKEKKIKRSSQKKSSISAFDLFNHSTLLVTQSCPLKCDFCPLWDQARKASVPAFIDEQLPAMIRNNDYFKFNKISKIVDVVGGDPLRNNELKFILEFLHARGIRIRLWTTGLVPSEYYANLMDLVDEYFVYIPSMDAEEYRMITGFDGLESVLNLILFLKEQNKIITINHPIRVINIGGLPEVYDFAYQENLPLLLHYDPSEKFEKESLRYIRRMKRVLNTFIIESSSKNPSLCQSFPNFGEPESLKYRKNMVSLLKHNLRLHKYIGPVLRFLR